MRQLTGCLRKNVMWEKMQKAGSTSYGKEIVSGAKAHNLFEHRQWQGGLCFKRD